VEFKPLVSVVMNCFNGECYLKDAIDSVCAQTYKNLELIFWDNQSTDNSADMFLSYSDERLKYYYAPSHTTLYEARNCAVAKSNGELIAFLDVDDWWLPTKLEQQVPLFVDQEVGLVYSNFYWKNEIKNIEYVAHKRQLPSGFVLEKILQNYVIGMLTVMVRRSSYNQMQSKFNPAYNIIGDFDFAIRLAIDWKFASVQSPTAYCRWHGENLQISGEKRHIDELKQWLKSMSENQIISKKSEFEYFTNIVNRMSYVYAARKGDYLHAFKGVFLVYGVMNKIKIFIAAVLPSKVLNVILSKFS